MAKTKRELELEARIKELEKELEEVEAEEEEEEPGKIELILDNKTGVLSIHGTNVSRIEIVAMLCEALNHVTEEML